MRKFTKEIWDEMILIERGKFDGQYLYAEWPTSDKLDIIESILEHRIKRSR